MSYGTYGGTVKVVTASTGEPVTRAEMKTWLRIDEFETAEDTLVDSLITRARQRWEDITQRSAMVQTFDYYMDDSPSDGCPIEIPKAPLVSVTSIKGYALTDITDSGGTAMSTSGYYVDTAREFGRVMPLSAYTYPTATRDINGLIIRFTAGYSSATTGVPESVKTEIKQLATALYEHRGDEMEQARILDSYRSEYDLPSWG